MSKCVSKYYDVVRDTCLITYYSLTYLHEPARRATQLGGRALLAHLGEARVGLGLGLGLGLELGEGSG